MRNDPPIKIAIVNSEFSSSAGTAHGGIATYCKTIAQYLAQRGHMVHFFSRGSVIPCMDTSENLLHHQYRYIPPLSYTFRLLHYFFPRSYYWELGHARSLNMQLTGLAKNKQIDIIEFPEYGGLAYYYRRSHPIPYVLTFHTPSILVDELNLADSTPAQLFRYKMEASTIASADGYKSPSCALKNYALKRYSLNDEAIQIIRNPVNFEISEHITPASKDYSRFDILFSGRFEYRKGAGIILKTVKKILSIAPEVTLSIAGETEFGSAENYRHAVERSLSSEERKRVWFLGPLSYEHLLPLYRNSSLFLFPSLYENAPYSLFEAMSSGMPIIASDSGGVSEVITHEENGLLFSPESPDDIVVHVKRMYNERKFAEKMGNNAARSIRTLLNPDSLIDEHIDFYRSVLNRTRNAPA
jgi:glycosyltransferase involved in cell wall biosynthesis